MNIRRLMFGAAIATLGLASSNAQAELVLSQLIVELAPHEHQRADIEAWNNGSERLFVTIDPREIVAPGTEFQSSRVDLDPDRLGLLVSPGKMILEPGQRKLIRIVSIASEDRERIYRVTVKPVMGQLSSAASGIKLLVGYDVLVLVRPTELKPHVSSNRSDGVLTLTNDGNVSVELVEGKACAGSPPTCTDLPSGRLYVGANKRVAVPITSKVTYKLKIGSNMISTQF